MDTAAMISEFEYPAPLAPMIVVSFTNDDPVDASSLLDDWGFHRAVNIYHDCQPDNEMVQLGGWDWIRGAMIDVYGDMIQWPNHCTGCDTRLVSEEWAAVLKDIRQHTRGWN